MKQVSFEGETEYLETPLVKYFLNSFLLQILPVIMAVDHEKHEDFFLDFIFILIH